MHKVVSCLLLNKEGEILILKRSKKVKTYKGMWGVVAGYIEKDEKPFDTAIKEIKEEIGLNKNDVKFVKGLDAIKLMDYYNKEKYDWLIFPFVFNIKKKDKINIDWEHLEYRWIKPSQIKNYKTVPYLKEMVLEIM